VANWTPQSFIGELFKTLGKYIPPAPGVKSPALWGSKAHLDTLFGSKATIAAQSKNFVFRYKSPKHWVEIFRSYYGPVTKAFEAIDPQPREALEAQHLRPARQIQRRRGRHAGPPKRISRSGHQQKELIAYGAGAAGMPRPLSRAPASASGSNLADEPARLVTAT
jgi:hypothetical protein